MNIVGTGVRDCAVADGAPCYGTGSIPFSLRHLGAAKGADPTGYSVRTHEGELETVYLHDGVIESGRALAAERTVTNPLSSGDRALLQDYRRGELRGRPMPGYYTIRIWDAPGVELRRIEDVQLVWDYRYFTRTGESAANACTP